MSDVFLRKNSGRRVVMDDRLLRREFYNPNNFAVLFYRIEKEVPYIVQNGINPGLPAYRLKPDGFLVLPHIFFEIRAADPGVQIFDMVVNYGKDIGTGNKLPSRPEVKVDYSR